MASRDYRFSCHWIDADGYKRHREYMTEDGMNKSIDRIIAAGGDILAYC